MPLPLPNLDTRRWTDLVDEGRALIPRYAPAWTDHNAHDPGITLIELLAWLIEQEVYRANRIPETHRRKLLALAGFPVLPPRPAQTIVSFSTSGPASVALPAGFTVAAIPHNDASPAASLRFRLATALTVHPATIRALQTFDGHSYVDQTRAWRAGRPFLAWGDDPASTTEAASSPALYIGFDAIPSAGEVLSLWLAFEGERTGTEERDRLQREAIEQAELCRPFEPEPCKDDVPATGGDPLPEPPHHGATAVWEYFDGAVWQPLAVADSTRCFSLDGPVQVTLPADLQPSAHGPVEEALSYLRCRLSDSRPDAAPLLRALALNAVAAHQTTAARTAFEILPGVTPPAGQEPASGQTQRLQLGVDGLGRVTSLSTTTDESWPETAVLAYVPATATAAGELICDLVFAGLANGLPGQALTLPIAPVADGACRIFVLHESAAAEWRVAPDLDAALPADLVAAFDPDTGRIVLADGVHGRLPPRSAAIVASYATTHAAAGNVAAGMRWQVLGTDDAWNDALLGGGLAAAAAALGPVANPLAATGGAQDSIAAASGRAAELLWCHERLLELAAGAGGTLDQLDRAHVKERLAPPRATTLLDYERLALDVPGTTVARARAWSGVDAGYLCLQAPGTVAVVIVPGLPKGRPEPTPGLIEAVRRYLDRRRTIGTRLVVVGPEYVTVRVRARIHTRNRADVNRARADILKALDHFLDPMTGGPSGHGWPFGRDVYRAEVLQVIDGVEGVDYIESLSLFAGDEEAVCGNVCIGLRSLTTPGDHELEVI